MSNTPAVPTNQSVAVPGTGLPEGLDDINSSDLTMPIFRIDHERGCFVNGLTQEEFPYFDAVLLGVKKQRILWPMDPGEGGEQPMCRSYDFVRGFPRPETWVQPQKNNPKMTAVNLSGFSFPQLEAAAEADGLSCADCPLKDWGQDRQPPWCNEQWTFPFVRIDEDGDPIPGVISFQRTGLKPCKSYVSAFVQAKSALYTVVTRISAVVTSKGTVSWVVPKFQRLQDSDSTQWPTFSTMLHDIGDFLSTPRIFSTPDPDGDAVTQATTTTATVTQPAPEPPPTVVVSAPEPAPEPAAAPTAAVVPPEAEQTPQPVQRAEPSAAPAAAPAAPYNPDEEPF